MNKLSNYLNLIRIKQWYKNLVIFIPLFFAQEIFAIGGLEKTLIGFFALCFISSVNYILNDILDLKKDKIHPEKRHRPLASGNLSVNKAIILMIFLLFSSMILSINLSSYFLLVILTLFFSTLFYSIILKNILFLDVILISFNFVLRIIAGIYVLIINNQPWITPSPWLIFCPFFLSLFLSIGKRHGDLIILKDKAGEHKKVLKEYSPELTKPLIIITATLLIISYSFYSFLSVYHSLIYTLPIALYLIFRYLYLIEKGSVITRHPEQAIKDMPLVIGALIWVLLTFILIYGGSL